MRTWISTPALSLQRIRRVRNVSRLRKLAAFLRMLLLALKRMLMKYKVNAMGFLAMITVSYRYLTHRRFWTGFWDSVQCLIRFHRPYKFRKQTYTASDGEIYSVWTPKPQTSSCAVHDTSSSGSYRGQHLWICLPGGMEAIDPAFSALISKQTFKGSKVCQFNNPGIATRMRSKPLPSPTETMYIIEYIRRIQRDKEYRVSLIGFSIGSVQALRTLHDIESDPTLREEIRLESVVLVHGPDIVRDAIQHFAANWMVRMDVYFAFHIRWLQHWSGSWDIIKDKVNTEEDQYYVLSGWRFIERVSVVSLGKEWTECENEMFNLRNLCDESICDSATRVYRVIARNDWVVPYSTINPLYFKFLDEVFITDRGGHCGVSQCVDTVSKIALWNDRALEVEGAVVETPLICSKTVS